MSNEETVLDTVIDIFDSYELYQGSFIVGDIISDIVNVFGGEDNDIVVGVLEELSYIDDMSIEEDFFTVGRKLEDLRDSLIVGDIPKIVTDPNLVLDKVFRDLMKDPVRKAELNSVIREVLEKDKERERVEVFVCRLISLCQDFDLSLMHEDTEGSFIIKKGFNFNNINSLMSAYYDET